MCRSEGIEATPAIRAEAELPEPIQPDNDCLLPEAGGTTGLFMLGRT